MSFWIGNVLLVILNIPLIGVWVRMLMIPYHLLYPAVLMFICIGTFSLNNSAFDVWMVVFFGFFGFAIRIFNWPAAPILLGFVLGPLMEEHFRRAMLISQGDFMIFLNRPISSVVLAITAAILVWGIFDTIRQQKRRRYLSSRPPA